MPAKTQNHLKNKKLKQSNKLNKNIPIAKTLEAFTPKAKFVPFLIGSTKIGSKPIFVFEIGPV